MTKVWQYLLLIIVGVFAAQLVIEVVQPVLPTLVALVVAGSVIYVLLARRRRW